MKIILPSWVPHQLNFLAVILDKLAPWRLVGGIVRDIIMGTHTVDIDIAIAAFPDEVMQYLEKHGVKVVPTGIKHGTVSVYMDGGVRFEITSLRRDEYCDGRWAEISFTDDWQEDASRRDFTMNAMYLDMDGKIDDYFDGYNHLLQKKVVFVGDPKKRIQEDYLRVLRYWRFVARMGMDNVDLDSQKAAMELFDGLRNVSGERIQGEMFKLLSGPFALEVINFMIANGMLVHLNLKVNRGLQGVTSDPLLNLALLLRQHPDGANIQAIKELSLRWKLAKVQRNLLKQLCCSEIEIDWSMPVLEHKKYMYLLGKEVYSKMFLIAHAEKKVKYDYMKELADFSPPKLPLTGVDIEFLQGVKIGEALKEAKKYWLEKDFLCSKDDLLMHIKLIYS